MVAGNVIRIAVELVQASTGFSRWSEKFERQLSDILSLQDDIANAVDSALSSRLSRSNRESRASNGGTQNVAAFDAYLRGKDLFDFQRDEASDRGSLEAFSDAVQLDPGYAAARAARSRALAVIANEYAQAADRRPLYSQAVDEAKRAISAAPHFAEAYAALGYALFYGELDIMAADEPYERARQFGSGSPDVLGLYAIYRARRRQFDRARPAIARAVELDPINPVGLQESSAESALRLAIMRERSPVPGARSISIRKSAQLTETLAMLSSCKVELTKLPLNSGGRRCSCWLSRAEPSWPFAKGTLRVHSAPMTSWSSHKATTASISRPRCSPSGIEVDEALERLERCVEERDSGLVYLLSDPFLASMQKQQRFKQLLRRLHFV